MNLSKTLLNVSLAILASSLSVCAQAQTVTFTDFNGKNGWLPFGSVIQATDGNLYGTTAAGGLYDGGNVFRMTPEGKIVSIYNFCSQANCADGQWPKTAPVLGSDGNLWGITFIGGAGANGPTGNGILYRMTLQGKITILHTFSNCYTGCPDGVNPTAFLLASDGNFYGTTSGGGSREGGTIFQVSSTGQFKTLHSFCSQANCIDGSEPWYGIVEGNDGNIYGTTILGGSLGGGVFFRITPAGAYTVLYNFAIGDQPNGVVRDTNGNFFGTSLYGGAFSEGSIFEITPTGQYTNLHDFNYNLMLGQSYPQLTVASDGNLYGVLGGTWAGSWAGQMLGGLYKITPEGVFTPLYAFCQCGPTNGYAPQDSLFQATDGNLYGTTGYNGFTGYNKFSGFGTIFKLSTGLSPIVETVPSGAKVGKQVLILGNHLTGTTGVMFNGVQANFTVVSDTYIKATVPSGATTGKVSVVTPSGTLNSNPQFVVTK